MRSALLLFVLLTSIAAAGPSREWDVASWRWRRVPVATGRAGGLLAVASLSADPGRVAVGHDEGVSLRVGTERFRFVARVTGVRDLAFDPDGSLWIGSLDGLWHLSRDGQLSDRSPAPGEFARAVHRVIVGQRMRVVGTEAGAWSSRDGRRWLRLSGGLPTGPVTALALREASDELWLVAAGDLWRLDLKDQRARRIQIAGAPTGVAPTDLATGLPEIDVAVLYPRSLAVLGPGLSSFQVVRPVWPPGAVARRLVAGAGRLWLATDLGLLSAPGFAGPWRRSEPPAGSAAIRSVAVTAADGGVLAASGLGLLHGSPVLRARASPATRSLEWDERRGERRGERRERADPDIRSVHRASLQYLDLGPERIRDLHSGLALRGWIPSVSLRIGAARDHSRQRDYDEAFVSGETRRLNDDKTDRSLDLEASLVMSWDLGALAFDDDAIDISREHRLIVSLRDNVIDEINQLYFERLGLLEKLAHPGDAPDLDHRALQLRADELAAGLDAWTGGWFSRPEAHPALGPGRNLED
jgi:hypothetical protein